MTRRIGSKKNLENCNTLFFDDPIVHKITPWKREVKDIKSCVTSFLGDQLSAQKLDEIEEKFKISKAA